MSLSNGKILVVQSDNIQKYRSQHAASSIACRVADTDSCTRQRLFRRKNIVDSALTLEQKVSRLERKSIRIDDHEIVYMEGGSGPTILMLHGITADSGNWTRFARHFSNNYHVIIPDLPGFGRSSRIADASYSVPKQTERVRALMQALGVDNSIWSAIRWAATSAPITPPLIRTKC